MFKIHKLDALRKIKLIGNIDRHFYEPIKNPQQQKEGI